MGTRPTEEELFQLISEVDDNMSGAIDFSEFLKVVETQKKGHGAADDEAEFGACPPLPQQRAVDGRRRHRQIVVIWGTDAPPLHAAWPFEIPFVIRNLLSAHVS